MRGLIGIVIVASLTVPGIATADSAPEPSIIKLLQEGQDVEVTIRIPIGYELKDEYSLSRDNPHEISDLFAGRIFTEEEAASVHEYCYDTKNEKLCEDNPDCADCNDDGVPECMDGYCSFSYTFEVLDECVPPGVTTYSLDSTWGMAENEIDVEDTADECLPELDTDTDEPASDSDADSDADGDSDGDAATDDDSSESCSVTSVGRSASPYRLNLIMLVIGLVAAKAGRE